jgi:hypothetical protein
MGADMAEPKPLASLSAGLLARKGAASPAMRRQAVLPSMNGHAVNGHGHDDLGWNDMGYDVDPMPQAADPVRNGSHGLSPMASHHDDTEDRIVRDALSAAVDRAIESPPMPTVRFESARVEPIQPDMAVPDSNHELVVHRHQQRLVAEITPEPVVQQPVAEQPIVAQQPAAIEPPAVEVPMVVKPQAPRASRPRVSAGSKGAFAFTLRLDPERHLRLRLASATSNRSAQQILISLVDDFLATQPEIAAFAAQLPPAQSKH